MRLQTFLAGSCEQCISKTLLCLATSWILVATALGHPERTCSFPNGVKGKCETTTSCADGAGTPLVDGKTSPCSDFEGQKYVCCRRPFDVAAEMCNSWKSYWRDNAGKCIFKTPMIVGGEEANVGQFPEISLLGVGTKENRITWQCGGTLISPLYVLTAAHCVIRLVPFSVRLGEHNMEQEEALSLSRVIGPVPLGLAGERELHFESRNSVPVEQFIRVSDVIIHPDYDSRYNDIALLKLEKPAVLTKRVLPACLPSDPDEDYLGFNLTVAGWGRLRYDLLESSITLQKVTIPVIDRLTCWKDLERLNARLIPKGITQEQLCAGELGKDSCKGDSGGPLLVQAREGAHSVPCEHTVAGIVSFGNGCGRFGVYTRVSSYVQWITDIVAPEVVPNRRKEHRKTTTTTKKPPKGGFIFFPS